MRHFTAGLEAYRRQLWEDAIALFNQSLALWPDDGPSRIMAERCRIYREAFRRQIGIPSSNTPVKGSNLLSDEADSLRDKGTMKRHKGTQSQFRLICCVLSASGPMCLCNFVPSS